MKRFSSRFILVAIVCMVAAWSLGGCANSGNDNSGGASCNSGYCLTSDGQHCCPQGYPYYCSRTGYCYQTTTAAMNAGCSSSQIYGPNKCY